MDTSSKEQPFSLEKLEILLIEDDQADAEYFLKILAGHKEQQIQAFWVKDVVEAQRRFAEKEFSLIVLNPLFQGRHGLDNLNWVKTYLPHIPIVILAPHKDRELTIQMVQEGAQDCLTKDDLNKQTFMIRLRYAFERSLLRRSVTTSQKSFFNLLADNYDGILVINEEHNVVYANPVALSLFERSENTLVGSPFGMPLTPSRTTILDLVRGDGKIVVAEMRTSKTYWDEKQATLVILHDITDRQLAEIERERLITELREALAQVKQLSGLLPICSNCKKIRNDEGYWDSVEKYVTARADVQFSHGICPDCLRALYPENADEILDAAAKRKQGTEPPDHNQ
jgi:DNA-binding response OmpR family regulator